MSSSVREYAILYVGKGGKSGQSTTGGGNAILNAGQHVLDGPEHTDAGDSVRLDATDAHHGLLPKLSGVETDVLDGEGVFRDNDAARVSYDPTASGLVATDAQAAIDELAATPVASALDDLTDVTITTPAAAERLRYNGAQWVNSSLIWRPVMTLDASGNYLPVTTGVGDAVMTEA